MGTDLYRDRNLEEKMGIEIFGHDFEESVTSENGQFFLAWSDTSPDGVSGGARDSGTASMHSRAATRSSQREACSARRGIRGQSP